MNTDPYRPPNAPLDPSTRRTRSIWWKLYLFILAALSALGFAGVFADPAAGLPEYVSAATTLIAFVGFFGFVFVRPILAPNFWLITLVIHILFSIAYYFLTDIDLSGGYEDATYYFSIVISWAISVPFYIGLYRYSKPSDLSWSA